MFEDICKYVAFFRIGLKNGLAYAGDAVLSLIMRIGLPLVMLAVWYAIYLVGNTSTIGGFSLTQTYSYFFTVSLVAVFTGVGVLWDIQSDFLNGLLSASLVRPVNYVLASVASDFSWAAFQSVLIGIPMGVLLVLVLHLSISPLYMVLFVLELVVALALTYAIQVLVATLTIYVTYVSAIYNALNTAIAFLGGFVLPLNFFPQQLVGILRYVLPFQILAYTPAVTFLGAITVPQALASIGVALVWLLALAISAALFWRRAIKRITIAGG